MDNLKHFAKKHGLKALAFGGIVAASPSFAITAADITSAITSATSNVGATMAGVVSVAALCFGAGLIIRWLSK